LVVLTVNAGGYNAGHAGDVGGYSLPILQDTAEADVFGSWGASVYDLFIVGRDGAVAYYQPGARPADAGQYESLLTVLTAFE
jgi:hypothetical protein